MSSLVAPPPPPGQHPIPAETFPPSSSRAFAPLHVSYPPFSLGTTVGQTSTAGMIPGARSPSHSIISSTPLCMVQRALPYSSNPPSFSPSCSVQSTSLHCDRTSARQPIALRCWPSFFLMNKCCVHYLTKIKLILPHTRIQPDNILTTFNRTSH